jgi:hypothetical protein
MSYQEGKSTCSCSLDEPAGGRHQSLVGLPCLASNPGQGPRDETLHRQGGEHISTPPTAGLTSQRYGIGYIHKASHEGFSEHARRNCFGSPILWGFRMLLVWHTDSPRELTSRN